MGSFLGNVGRAISGAAESTFRATPYLAQVVAQHEAKKKADLATALMNMRQQSADNTASVLANIRAGEGLATMRKTNAEADKLGKPTPKVMRGPGGQLVTYDEDNPTQASTFGPPPIPKAPPAPVIGSKEWKDAERFKASLRPAPQPDRNVMTVADPNNPTGPGIITRRADAVGQHVPEKAAAAAGGSASLSADDRAKMLSQAKLDNETMKAYETDVLAGRKHVGTAAGVAGATADAHGGVMNNVIGVLGNTATGALDADYQKYLTAQRSYGRIMGNLQSKRYTDHQAEIERSISGLQGNDLPGTIQYKQSLRDASLADALPSVASSPAARGRGGPPPNVPHPQNRNDHPGPPNIGGGHSGDAEAAWAAKNPPHPGESFEAYHARFISGGAP